jgi:hypothetical protein
MVSAANGSMTKSFEINGNETILDLSAFQAGIYFVEVSNGTFVSMHRLILN